MTKRDEISSGESGNRELNRLFQRSSDAFDKVITDNTTNTLDIPSPYPFSSERQRLSVNGTKFRRIDNTNKITRTEGEFTLEAASGDNIVYFSAERPRYVVGYESLASAASKLDDLLEENDYIRIGLSDRQTPVNRAYFELNGENPDKVVVENDGEVLAEGKFNFPDISRKSPVRYSIKFNWYGIGRYLFTLSYTDNSKNTGHKQITEDVAELTVDNEFSTSDSGMHVFQQINIDSSNTGKDFRVGSMGFNVLGDVTPSSRIKSSKIVPDGDNYGGSGDYEALAALKINEDFGNIFTQIKNITAIPDSTEGEAVVIAVDSDDTDASNFSTPAEQSDSNSIILETENVSTFPNESGTVVTSTSDPNGRQVGFSATDITGQGSTASRTGSIQTDKRPIYDDDIAVILYKADSATSDDVNIVYQSEQFW